MQEHVAALERKLSAAEQTAHGAQAEMARRCASFQCQLQSARSECTAAAEEHVATSLHALRQRVDDVQVGRCCACRHVHCVIVPPLLRGFTVNNAVRVIHRSGARLEFKVKGRMMASMCAATRRAQWKKETRGVQTTLEEWKSDAHQHLARRGTGALGIRAAEAEVRRTHRCSRFVGV